MTKRHYQNKLIPGFSVHILSDDDINISAYGSSKYAFVINEDTLVIYDLDKGLYTHIALPEKPFWSCLTITSVVADKDNFFLSMSDGSVLSCFETRSGYDYRRYTDPIPGAYADDKAENWKPEKLLGVNQNWLVYQSTCNRLVFLSRESHKNPKPTFSDRFIKDIIAHAFCSDTGVLRVVIRKDKTEYWLYKIDPNKEDKKQRKQIFKLQVTNDSNTLLAVSGEGDMAFKVLGQLRIYRPETGDNSPKFTRLNPLTQGFPGLLGSRYGDACFATYHGSEYFILCIKGAIGIAKKNPKEWTKVYYCSNRALQQSAKFKISEAGYPYPENPKMDDQGRLVLRLANDPNSDDQKQKILVSSPFMTDIDR